ncbi:Endophilin-A2, partial [Manacus vitellinus]
GDALLDAGESMKRLAEVKDSLDIEVKQNFIDPLQNLCDKDLKEIQHHLKKLEGRRLDFDYKKKRQGKIPDEELRQAMEKFEESKEVAETSMHNLLETDVRGAPDRSVPIPAVSRVSHLDELAEKLKRRISKGCLNNNAAHWDRLGNPTHLGVLGAKEEGLGVLLTPVPPPVPAAPLDQPCCKALYDFEPENDGELGFKEGDIITLTNQIDENWYEGMISGPSRFFPLNYVEVLVPLPQ